MLKNLRRTHRQQSRQAHRNALQQKLKHRLSIAETQDNQTLIRQLKAEAAYLHIDL